MPIFQDDLGDGRRTPPVEKSTTSQIPMPPLEGRTIARKVSEESIRTELCEGLVPDTPEEAKTLPLLGLDTGFTFSFNGTSDRGELIERLKKGESPTWLPNRNLESLLQNHEPGTPHKTPSNHSNSSPLLPSAELSNIGRPSSVDKQRSQMGLEIERPRSALHSGNFTDNPQPNLAEEIGQPSKIFDTGSSGWLATSPPRNFTPFQLDPRFPTGAGFERETQGTVVVVLVFFELCS
ncbi:succinate dehydrogenase protein [Rutstroemia sp. NJR-2017a BBW]|nr:succinate dehydrogenase protein [Rutstroemia sp. NJR-2017a BBW]